MTTNDLPPTPPGTEWRRADTITVGDTLHGAIRGRVTSVERKPKTVWITIEPANPSDVPLLALGTSAKAASTRIKPRHDDYLATYAG